MTVYDLPTLNATLNSIATILLIIGYICIRRQQRQAHMWCMIGALTVSAAFLTSYLYYHAHVRGMPYPLYDWTRPLYFAILIPHIILAALMVPPILLMVWFAIRRHFRRHRAIARWVWPVWLYVSITGVIIYLMLYQYANADAEAEHQRQQQTQVQSE